MSCFAELPTKLMLSIRFLAHNKPREDVCVAAARTIESKHMELPFSLRHRSTSRFRINCAYRLRTFRPVSHSVGSTCSFCMHDRDWHPCRSRQEDFSHQQVRRA